MAGAKIAYMVVASVISYYASKKLMRQEDKEVISDDRPTSTTTRGAWLPLLIGRRRLAPVISWVRDRTGSGSNIRESAGHLICIGPASKLHRIYFDGKVKFSQFLTRDTVPSGSAFFVDDDRFFRIYWGDGLEPVPGTPSEIGSRFPGICFVEWVNFLVDQTVWPEIAYDIEVDPIDSGNPNIQASVIAQPSAAGAFSDILDTNNGFPSINYVETIGDRVDDFSTGYAVLNLNDPIPEDMTLWESVSGVTWDGVENLFLVSVTSGTTDFATKTGLKNFPAAGKPITMTMRVIGSLLPLEPGDGISTLSLWNSTHTVEIVRFDYFSQVGEVQGDPPAAGQGLSYSFYKEADPSPYTVLEVTYIPEDDTYAEQDYQVEFSLTRFDNNTYQIYIRDLEISTDIQYPIRNVAINELLDSNIAPDDISSWDVVDVTNGILEYIDNVDPDFITMPVEVVSTFQNRFEVTNLVNFNSITSRENVVGVTYPAIGEKLEISFFISPSDGTFRAGASAQTGIWWWYVDLDMASGLITAIPDSSDTVCTVETTSLTNWKKITIIHTVASSESGRVGGIFAFKTSLSNKQISQATECWIADIEFGELSDVTRVELNEEVGVLVDNTGSIAPVIPAVISGANAAGAIHQLLFQPYPYGAGLDEADFDQTSLETLSSLMAEERLPLSILAKEGQDLEAVLASVLQDIGCVMYWNTSTSLWTFKPIRSVDSSEVKNIPTENLLKRPETILNLDDSSPNQVIFGFNDLNRRFKETTLLYDNDGEVSALYGGQAKRTRKTRIPHAITISSARRIAERRSQEELGKSTIFSIPASGESRAFNPGDVVTLESETGQLIRVLSVTEKSNSPMATISGMLDVYGIPEGVSGAGDEGDLGAIFPKADELNRIAEIPRLLTNNQNLLIDLRIRGEEAVIGANVFASYDDTNYFQDSTNFNNLPGGILNEDFSESVFQILEEGPVVSFKGFDADKLLDLSADESSWYNGRQIVVIGEEWLFIKKATFINSEQIRLDGVIRGRFGTLNVNHPTGTEVYILTPDLISGLVTRPTAGEQVYLKNSPFNATGGELPISQVSPATRVVLGDGTRPMPVVNINTPEGSKAYLTGGDAVLSWNYRNGNANNGAGDFGAGEPTYSAVPEGTFTLQILDGAVLKREVTGLTSPTYTYTNTQMITDFGAEPSSFLVQVTNISDIGLESYATTATIIKA